ncbi:FtsK/SpoIIIE domain-containing protein [Demequina gelatinilytica]|uniref:FtsK/SpoIIIE domain-containing protein n=1 Tax=Demequina gelatinilytica TaxID=1638980 RepID=UPI000784E077|nr:FtsK/SpoIIIE domain-containing protein [Demequina gelatinilytica]
MDVTIEDAGDVEVDPGTPLAEVLRIARAPAAVWCGGTLLDPGHRAGVAPLVQGALLRSAPGPPTVPPTGPHLAVVAGPDAGALLEVAHGAAEVGREGALALADPRLSRRHLSLDATGRARDLGSRNGTFLVRGARRRRVGRIGRRLRAGDLVLAGDTALRWVEPGHDADKTPRPHPAGARQAPMLVGLLGGAAGALALAVATGRWEIAAIALAAPLALTGAAMVRARAPRPPEPVGAELLADLPLPIAIRGTPHRARGAARALAVARGEALPPRLDEPWMRWCGSRLPDGAVTVLPPDGSPPSEARCVIDVDARTIAVDGRERAWSPSIVSRETADVRARARCAAHQEALPRMVRWAELEPGPAAEDPTAGAPFATALGRGLDGPVVLDLDRDGPHALVAGTTGAGKSALLETLVAGLAHGHAPARLAVALIDLKGGAGLGPCAALPHTCGLLTDLEPASARRALLGLAHELRQRKAALARAGCASWAQWVARDPSDRPPPRLLVVVDEFQELGAMDPGFLPELARLAAQGRSLGMHLVLATQRPAGVVTPAIRANVSTVIALRTANAAESQDLVGDASAAALPASAPGRAVVVTPYARVAMQTALPLAQARPPARPRARPEPAGAGLVHAATVRWAGAARPPRLWLDPLRGDERPAPGALGWIDLPAERAREPLRWDPASGPLVVVGPRGSGRSAALAAAAAAVPGAVSLPRDPREAARTLALAPTSRIPALLVDDADRACEELDPWMRGAGDALESLARSVPLALSGGPGWGARWASRAGLVVVLTGLDRVEQVLWGVPPPLASLVPEPGRGVAIAARGAGECRIGLAAGAPPRVLVHPLVCPADLPAGALGVIGDRARPWLPGAGAVVVVGPPEAGREAVAEALRRAGASASVSAHGDPGAAVEVVLAPTPARLRGLGAQVPPGIAVPSPPAGYVAVRTGTAWEAARLRPDAAGVSAVDGGP